MPNLVSIITPCYNSERFIADTIESVLAQSVPNWEMIIVDDNSTDSSRAIISRYVQKSSKIKLIGLNSNVGTHQARNIATRHAVGRYIAFLDSDDLWLPSKLEKQINFMTENQTAFSYTSYRLIDEHNNDLGVFITEPSVSYFDLLKKSPIGCLTVIYDIEQLGKMDMPNIALGEDYATWLEILSRIKVGKGILQPLAIYRMHKTSLSSNKIRSAICRWKVYRDFQKIGCIKSFYYFCHYVCYGVVKYRVASKWRSI